jgi:hypothetical protein
MSDKTKDIRPLSEAEHSIRVLLDVIRIIKRYQWLVEMLTPRSFQDDFPTNRETVEALRYAIDAVRGQCKHSSE